MDMSLLNVVLKIKGVAMNYSFLFLQKKRTPEGVLLTRGKLYLAQSEQYTRHLIQVL